MLRELISLWHLRHCFSSRSVQPLVLLTILGRVDDRVWTHLTLFLTVNPFSDHSRPLGCLVSIIVVIAFLLLIFARFSNLLSAHVVFLLLACKLCNRRVSRRSPFIGSISNITVCEILPLHSNIFLLAFSWQSWHLIAAPSVQDLLLNGSNQWMSK